MWILFKSLSVIKVFSHSKHIYSLTPVCIFWCAFKLCSSEKLFPHKEHECGFSFEGTFRWLFRLEAHKHFKVETAGLEDELCSWGLYMMFFVRTDLYRRYFIVSRLVRTRRQCWKVLWIFFLCLSRLDEWLKLFPHAVQWYGFSPVWILSCVFRCPEWLNLLSQCEHL